MERRNGDVVPSWDTRRLPVDERGPASFRVTLIIQGLEEFIFLLL